MASYRIVSYRIKWRVNRGLPMVLPRRCGDPTATPLGVTRTLTLALTLICQYAKDACKLINYSQLMRPSHPFPRSHKKIVCIVFCFSISSGFSKGVNSFRSPLSFFIFLFLAGHCTTWDKDAY